MNNTIADQLNHALKRAGDAENSLDALRQQYEALYQERDRLREKNAHLRSEMWTAEQRLRNARETS